MSLNILNEANNSLVQGLTITAVAGDQHIYHNAQAVGHGGQTVVSQGFDMLYQHYSTAALFDAIAYSNQPKCLKGTRVEIIKNILARIEAKERSGSILWLKGPAGVGKTALEYTIADICKKNGLLIGGFAFSRTAANRGDGNMLIPTLTIQLARAIPDTKVLIDNVLRDNTDIFKRSRETQLRLLIIEPLRSLWVKTRLINSFRSRRPYPSVIAIDGLDECSDRDVQYDIITTIGAVVQNLNFPLRFFIASRPEAHISHAFGTFQSDIQVNLSCVYLGEDAAASHDLQTYLETKFEEIRKLHPYLPETWPSSKVISLLVEKASGQFIYATTVMAYIMSVDARPEDCLQVILKLSKPPTGSNPYSPLDLLYSHIIGSVKDHATTQQLLGSLIVPEQCYDMPVDLSICEFHSPIVLEALFGLKRGDARRLMSDLLSVLTIDNDDQPMKVLHASLSDFILDESRSREHFVDPDKHCAILARKSIDYLAGLEPSHLDINDVEKFIFPAFLLCKNFGLIDELITVLDHVDVQSSLRSSVYSSPTQFPIVHDLLEKQRRLFGQAFLPRDAPIWSTYRYEFKQTRDKMKASPQDIFVIVTGPWDLVKSHVLQLTYDFQQEPTLILPDFPIAGQVRFKTPRRGNDPDIVVVMTTTRYGVPGFVADLLDKRLIESEYGVKSIHPVYRYTPNSKWHTGQENEWFWVWNNAKILD